MGNAAEMGLGCSSLVLRCFTIERLQPGRRVWSSKHIPWTLDRMWDGLVALQVSGSQSQVFGICLLRYFREFTSFGGHAAPVGNCSGAHVDPISLSLASLLYLLLVPTKERKGEQIVSRKVLNQLDAEKYSFTSPSFKTFLWGLEWWEFYLGNGQWTQSNI